MISGQIETRPLPVLLYQLLQQRFTGEVAVQTEGGSAQIFLTDGAAVQVLLPDNRDLLGQVLRDAGVISDTSLRRALSTPAGPGRRFGDVLLDLGLVEEPRLLQGLRLQVGRRLGRLFLLQRGGYLAVPGAHQRGLQGQTPVLTPMLWAIAYGARTMPLELLKTLLAERLGRCPRLLRERQIQLTGYGFDEVGTWLAQALQRGGRSVDELVRDSGAQAQALLAALYTLQVTDALVWDAEAAEPALRLESSQPSAGTRPPPSAGTRPPPRLDESAAPSSASAVPAPSSASAVPAPSTASSVPGYRAGALPQSGGTRPVSLADRALLTVEIEQRGQFIEQEDMFSVLGLGPDASTEEVEAAFQTLQQQFAAERLVQLGLGGMVRQAAVLAQRFQEAYDLLRVPTFREQQRRRLSGRSEEQEAKLQRSRAKLAFSRGVVLLRNREFAQSIPEFRVALRLRPDDGEIMGHLAWAEYGAGLRGRDECRRRILEAIERTPTAAALYYFAGVIYKVEGEEESALKCFAECCKRDSKSQAAASELRLLLLRKVRAASKAPAQGSSPSSQSSKLGGLLRPSSQSSKPQSPSSQTGKPGKAPAKPGARPGAPPAKSAPSLEDQTTSLLDALKQATTTEELLALWQKAEKSLPSVPSKRSSESTRAAAPSAESATSQRRGGLDFLRRPLGESLKALVELLQQPLGGSASSRSTRSSQSSQSLPRVSSGSSGSSVSGRGVALPSSSSNPSGVFGRSAASQGSQGSLGSQGSQNSGNSGSFSNPALRALGEGPPLAGAPLSLEGTEAELALLAGEPSAASASSASSAPAAPSSASASAAMTANPSTRSGRSLVELLQMPLAGNLKAILRTPITGITGRTPPPSSASQAPPPSSASQVPASSQSSVPSDPSQPPPRKR